MVLFAPALSCESKSGGQKFLIFAIKAGLGMTSKSLAKQNCFVIIKAASK
jgi:hypothetical protein